MMNIYLSSGSTIADGVVIQFGVRVLGESEVREGCVLGVNTTIEDAILKSNVNVQSSYIENSTVGENSSVGPFATIKHGSDIGANCRIGNFVEIKKSKIGDNTKIAHLTYVGDAVVGNDCNLGCGVVFCNYNGKLKQTSVVGDKVFIGSNVNIIAPVKISSGAYIAAGSTINKDVEENQFAIARSYQINKDNFKNPYKK